MQEDPGNSTQPTNAWQGSCAARTRKGQRGLSAHQSLSPTASSVSQRQESSLRPVKRLLAAAPPPTVSRLPAQKHQQSLSRPPRWQHLSSMPQQNPVSLPGAIMAAQSPGAESAPVSEQRQPLSPQQLTVAAAVMVVLRRALNDSVHAMTDTKEVLVKQYAPS